MQISGAIQISGGKVLQEEETATAETLQRWRKCWGWSEWGSKNSDATGMPEAGDESQRAGGESRMKENLPVVEPITEPV